MKTPKVSLFRHGSELLDDLNAGLRKAEKSYQKILKEEPDNAKKIAKAENTIKYFKRMIAEKEAFLGIKSKNK